MHYVSSLIFYKINLKSNMDRFIADNQSTQAARRLHLKSNMDRFIVSSLTPGNKTDFNLKSNMDRFIVLIIKG